MKQAIAAPLAMALSLTLTIIWVQVRVSDAEGHGPIIAESLAAYPGNCRVLTTLIALAAVVVGGRLGVARVVLASSLPKRGVERASDELACESLEENADDEVLRKLWDSEQRRS